MAPDERVQGLVFGEVADLYQRHRPGYPAAAFQAMAQFAGLVAGSPVLEIGAGTGKASRPLLRLGVRLTALEPSPGMARVWRQAVGASPGTRLVETTFEAWNPGRQRFQMVCCAQAWHWLDPELAFPKAARLLAPGGALALIWNRPQPELSLSPQLDRIYRDLVPELAARLHAVGEDEDWAEEIAGSGVFGPVTTRSYRWRRRYSAAAYRSLLLTQSDHRMLEPALRERLLAAVEAALAESGGGVVLPYVTRLHLARPLRDDPTAGPASGPDGPDNGRRG